MKRLKSLTAILLAAVFCGCSASDNSHLNHKFGEEFFSYNDETISTDAENTDAPIVTDGSEITPSQTENNQTSTVVTGNLSQNSSQYEGTAGTGAFNYGEALQKSVLFYELQRSGDLPENTRCNWRGDSGMSDGSDNGVDLTGGLYDAGDNVKFNLPMSYTGAMLAWSVYDDSDCYKKSGQLEYQLDNLRWINDYLMKCHTAEYEYYYQVGDGSADHAWWGPCEVMQMNRPSYKVTLDSPGSAVVGEAAASLAACAAVFKDIDSAYSAKCLKHAKELYTFAEKTMSDSGYTAANGFYNSWSGYYDELTWAAMWLYKATGDKSYLEKAKKYFPSCDQNTEWTMCWDNVTLGAAVLLADADDGKTYKDFIETNLDFWLNRITYTPDGLAWLDSWGSLRYATSEAFIAAAYSESKACPPANAPKYWDFAVSQVNYALGSTGRSYVCGFGENYPVNPHHRTAQGSYCDNKNEPATARHTLYGALVGGPDASGRYNDDVADYTANEVACDYNAGFTGILVKLYGKYGGKTLVNFGAVEKPTCNELYVDACVNASGSDFTEIKAIVYNVTAWPARVTDKLELRYYMNLSEVASPSDLKVTMNYAQGGTASIMSFDKAKNLYYVSIDFSGDKIYPGGQNSYKREVQFRISANGGAWDASNDPSYACLSAGSQGSLTSGSTLALYDGGKLVYGAEPSGNGVSVPVVTSSENANKPDVTTAQQGIVSTSASNGDLSVKYGSSDLSPSQNLTVNIEITNKSKSAISLSGLEIKYFLTAGSSSGLSFVCDHTAIQNGDKYVALSGISGKFSAASGEKADSCLTISCSDKVSIEPGGTWKIQGRINKADWSNFNPSNCFSAASAENIAIYSGGKLIFGKEPK